MKTYTSAVQQRHGEFALPGRLVAWSVVPGHSGWERSITSMTLPDETIKRIITLLCQMSIVLDDGGARLLADGEQDVYSVAIDDIYLNWEDDSHVGGVSGGLWPREIEITTSRDIPFARLSLTWPETREQMTGEQL